MANSVISYVPALHRGYLDFFTKYGGQLFLLGHDLVLEYPRMERDIRALTAEEIKKALIPFKIFDDITIVTKANVAEVLSGPEFYLPDEDITRDFATKYLGEKKANFVSVFLRWDGHNAQKTNPVNPDQQISADEFDREVMTKSFIEAEKSSDWWRQVGAAVVKDGQTILIGHNRPLPAEGTHNIFGDPRSNFDYGVSFELSKFLHAEAGVIAEAAKRGISLDGAHIYVTTFPCPVCAKSIAASGFKKVFYAEGYCLLDAEDILKGVGAEIVQVQF